MERALVKGFLDGDADEDGALTRAEYLAMMSSAAPEQAALLLAPFALNLDDLLKYDDVIPDALDD